MNKRIFCTFPARSIGLDGWAKAAHLSTLFLLFAHFAAGQKISDTQTPQAASHAKPRADVALFRARVGTALADARAQKANWGILVADRDTGETLYTLNADHFFTPASNAKIFTSALALSMLDPNYQFRTTLESSGKLGSDGSLAGDLILAGRGDPDLSNRKFPYAEKSGAWRTPEKILAEMADVPPSPKA